MNPAWRREVVSEVPVDLFIPVALPRAAVIWLHGFDQQSIQGRPKLESAFAAQELLVVAPQGGQTWWLDHVTACFTPPLTPAQLVVDALPTWLEQQWSIRTPLIALAGIGMGGQGAVNLGFRNARRFPVVAAVAPDVDFHQWHGAGTPLDRMFASREAARQQTATLHLHPLNWPRHLLLTCDPDDAACFEGTERLASKLISSGIPFECDFQTRAGGHSWEYFERMMPRVTQHLGDGLRQVADSLPTNLTT